MYTTVTAPHNGTDLQSCYTLIEQLIGLLAYEFALAFVYRERFRIAYLRNVRAVGIP